MAVLQSGRRASQLSANRSRAAVGSRPSLVYSRNSRKPSVFATSIDDIRVGRVASGDDSRRKSLMGQNQATMSAAELRRSASVNKDLRAVSTGNGARNSVLMAEAARHIAAYPPVPRQSLAFSGRDFPATRAESNAQHRAAMAGMVREDTSMLRRGSEKVGADAAEVAGGSSKVRVKPTNKYPNDYYDGRVSREYYDDYRF